MRKKVKNVTGFYTLGLQEQVEESSRVSEHIQHPISAVTGVLDEIDEKMTLIISKDKECSDLGETE